MSKHIIDTNVLNYAFSRDKPVKSEKAIGCTKERSTLLTARNTLDSKKMYHRQQTIAD